MRTLRREELNRALPARELLRERGRMRPALPAITLGATRIAKGSALALPLRPAISAGAHTTGGKGDSREHQRSVRRRPVRACEDVLSAMMRVDGFEATGGRGCRVGHARDVVVVAAIASPGH